ncbi:hypothetical protein MKK88_21565 [Methylobacterium sp. E-005]|uniref:hypothetical protein n=1 Tax=Methylobacterium sp. E-005 TaxID=2836549 RepID=UPI001FB966F2|nr:hypothetical protein [Methylobacterium sp. E-005]MCJ2088546.1 hypothetical protein [Methylobacterium sp. E-005]
MVEDALTLKEQFTDAVEVVFSAVRWVAQKVSAFFERLFHRDGAPFARLRSLLADAREKLQDVTRRRVKALSRVACRPGRDQRLVRDLGRGLRAGRVFTGAEVSAASDLTRRYRLQVPPSLVASR